jgi:light-regulated signal transduction histidine kinase (bacteriophytochrome)
MQLASHLPRVEGDMVQLQQVMLNLIVNAIQAMSNLRDGVRELHISTDSIQEGASSRPSCGLHLHPFNFGRRSAVLWRQTPRNEEGDRGAGAPVGGDHAPDLGGRHRVPVDPGGYSGVRA